MLGVRRPLGVAACLLVIIIALSALRIPEDYLGIFRACDEADTMLNNRQYCEFSGEIYHKEIKTGGQTVYYLRDATLSNGNVIFSQVSFFLSVESDEIPLFSNVSGTGEVYCLKKAANEGNFDEKKYYNSLGLICGIKKCSINEIGLSPLSHLDALYRLRRRVAILYEKLLPSEESGLLSAIALGDKAQLDSQVKDMFLGAGIVHILAVSGLHISLICMSLFSMMRRLGLGYGISGGCSCGIAIIYVIMAGMSVSSLRACGMFLIYMFAEILGESYDMATALGLMAIIILMINPCYIINSGFIFSFGAVFAVSFVARPIAEMYLQFEKANRESKVAVKGIGILHDKNVLLNIKSKVVQSMLFSVSVTLGTLPLSCYFNYQVPLLGVLLNIILIPFLPVLLGCGLLGGFLGCICYEIGEILIYPCHLILFSYEWAASQANKVSEAVLICGRPSIWKMILYSTLQIIIIATMNRLFFDKEYPVDLRRSAYFARLGCTVTASLLLSLMLLIPAKKSFEVDILDVGQGDGIYICTPEGVSFFIDGGSSDVKEVGKYRILPFLKYKGVGNIRYWFVTHSDKDHVSGLVEIIESGYSVDNIVFAKNAVEGDYFEELKDAALNNNINICYMSQGDNCGTQRLKLSCLYPKYQPTAGDDEDANAMSLVLLMGYDTDYDNNYYESEDTVGLFTGDIGSNQEKNLVESYARTLSRVDFIKVAHHGSKYSNCVSLVESLGDCEAYISCGYNNSYGHPHKETLERFSEADIIVHRTDMQGQLKIK
ncbi:MAG: DNA internalization-related competence protein ComEC/Rec2 [Pseudobutyrivibrio sp.]|nr:DNA internalization-related competence protein ComEC/Rec2 [Pseudobutyrivibrio sp.]